MKQVILKLPGTIFRVLRIPTRQALSSIFMLSASIVLLPSGVSAQERLEQHFDGVLGTSLDIIIYGENIERMEAAVSSAIDEISRLEDILTTYSDDSDLMQLNTNRSIDAAPTALRDVVMQCEHWFDLSDGNFSCRLGEIVSLWDAAERNQEFPSIVDVLPLARQISESDISIDAEQGAIVLGDAISLDPSGLAKGYIIDRGMEVLQMELPGASAIKLDIGGDAAYWGSPPRENGWQVQVADPAAIADNGNYLTTLALNDRAIATSGHTSRTRTIGSREFSHILVPQRGWPVTNGVYAVVIAPDATTADTVATTLAVQTIGAGLAWVNSLENVEALLIDFDGTQQFSRNWQDYLSEELKRLSNATINFTMNYTIPDIAQRDYERPYLAVWVSTADGRSVKNLLLLGGEERWARENSRWWRSARDLDRNVTRPTRSPGSYQLTWDGRDDTDTAVLPGEYILHVEASREHGGHDYKRVPFMLNEGTITFDEEGGGEVGEFSVSIEMDL